MNELLSKRYVEEMARNGELSLLALGIWYFIYNNAVLQENGTCCYRANSKILSILVPKGRHQLIREALRDLKRKNAIKAIQLRGRVFDFFISVDEYDLIRRGLISGTVECKRLEPVEWAPLEPGAAKRHIEPEIGHEEGEDDELHFLIGDEDDLRSVYDSQEFHAEPYVEESVEPAPPQQEWYFPEEEGESDLAEEVHLHQEEHPEEESQILEVQEHSHQDEVREEYDEPYPKEELYPEEAFYAHEVQELHEEAQIEEELYVEESVVLKEETPERVHLEETHSTEELERHIEEESSPAFEQLSIFDGRREPLQAAPEDEESEALEVQKSTDVKSEEDTDEEKIELFEYPKTNLDPSKDPRFAYQHHQEDDYYPRRDEEPLYQGYPPHHESYPPRGSEEEPPYTERYRDEREFSGRQVHPREHYHERRAPQEAQYAPDTYHEPYYPGDDRRHEYDKYKPQPGYDGYYEQERHYPPESYAYGENEEASRAYDSRQLPSAYEETREPDRYAQPERVPEEKPVARSAPAPQNEIRYGEGDATKLAKRELAMALEQIHADPPVPIYQRNFTPFIISCEWKKFFKSVGIRPFRMSGEPLQHLLDVALRYPIQIFEDIIRPALEIAPLPLQRLLSFFPINEFGISEAIPEIAIPLEQMLNRPQPPASPKSAPAKEPEPEPESESDEYYSLDYDEIEELEEKVEFIVAREVKRFKRDMRERSEARQEARRKEEAERLIRPNSEVLAFLRTSIGRIANGESEQLEMESKVLIDKFEDEKDRHNARMRQEKFEWAEDEWEKCLELERRTREACWDWIRQGYDIEDF